MGALFEQSRMTDEPTLPKPKSRRGFAAMDPAKREAIARKGGKAVPAGKRAFAMDRNLAAAAGRAGGSQARIAKRRAGRTAARANDAGPDGSKG
jgi:general stress protein YciG